MALVPGEDSMRSGTFADPTSIAIMIAHAAVIPPGAVSPPRGALAIPIAAVVVVIGTVIGIPPGAGIPPPTIVVGKSTPAVAVTWVVSACMKMGKAWPGVKWRMPRYRQVAAIHTAARSHEPAATVISTAANKRRTASRSYRARSDRDASTVANRSTAADETASTHSGAVTHSASNVAHSAANMASPNMAHPSPTSVAALGEGGIRNKGRNRQKCATCDQQLLHSRLQLTEHARACFG